ncbi:MAG: RNA polymerase sigma factor [Nitrospirae bacterium]|nr:RNA polymerase sigma factor [Nitrospirota bacterium]
MDRDIQLTDEDLIKGLKAGDAEAFNELVERYKRMGFSLAYNMVGSIEDAEDVSQEAFAIVYTKIKGFRGDCSFKTWFYRIIINLCRKHYRKNKFASIISLNIFPDTDEEKTIEIKAKDNVERELLSRQLNSAITAAVRKLPAKQREVFVMKHLRGMKIHEISEVLNCAEGTVKAHLFRAVKGLQKRLKGFYNEM